MSLNIFKHSTPFKLEFGEQIESLQIAYHTYGSLNKDKSNVVWAFHALTANADVLEWWPGLFGDADFFNPKEHFIICANIVGSPYGSSSPKDLDFPLFSARDVVNAQISLAEELQIEHIHIAIGGSFGGSQALEFAYSFPGKIDNLIMIASAAKESAWGVAIHEAQRLAIKADNTFGTENGGQAGLKAARGLALLTYRTSSTYIEQQSDNDDTVDDFKAASYIQYQGEKLVKRFNALSFYYLSKCLDTHNVARGRNSTEEALSTIKPNTLVISLSTDILIPSRLSRQMADLIPGAVYKEIDSEFGHDGFLIETKRITHIISNFLKK